MLAALSIIGIGIVAQSIAIFAQADAPSTDIGAYISGGGSAAAVGGLVYVVRQILSGNLISRPTSVAEQELVRLINASHEREALLQEVQQDVKTDKAHHTQLTEKLIRVIGKWETTEE